MDFPRALRRLWRHPLFRRLLALRIATQASDAALQVGLATYVLFSPNNQPDAGSIAAVLAVTLLPFSLVGPFVSGALDTWNRRQVFVITDLIRVLLAAGLCALVLLGGRTPAALTGFFVLALLALSINRFMMAGMSAALTHTVDRDEYLLASSVMPVVGPVGAAIGAGTAGAIRLVGGASMPAWQADALIFAAGTGGFVISVVLALRIPRDALGPDHRTVRRGSGSWAGRARLVLVGLGDAVRHLRERSPAGLGLVTIFAQRLAYGMITVSVILLYRNWFHRVDEVGPALAGLGFWVGATGAGFLLAAAVTPVLARRIGLRNTITFMLISSAVLQLAPGSIITEPTLVVAAFGLGLAAQALKIGVDTLVQAHVEDEYKGRVFVLYDMVFNVAFVGSAVLTMLLFPADGHTIAGFVALAGIFVVIAVAFALAANRIGRARFEEGTPSDAPA